MSNYITMELGTLAFFLILTAILILILLWQFIRSAVKAGTKEAIEEVLKNQKLAEDTINNTNQKIC